MTLTPDQFNNLATKEDLEDLKRELPTRKQVEELLKSNEAILTEIQTVRAEQAAMHGNYQEVESRVETLEQRVGLKPA